jgi:gamma-glutamylcyclotransferase (GGCT)/AIG2-like uncharacterized protein YtfP
MLYFAYGSNMDWPQMRDRCPSAKFVTAAKLPNYRLKFDLKSNGRGCGVSNVEFDNAESVWGVVYEIPDTEIGLLDKREGYRPGRDRKDNQYVREERHVLRDGDENQPLLVAIYFGNAQPNPPLPDADYKKLLVDGASFWHLPPDYIEKLKRIKTAKVVKA